jgi:hypothetical protein
MTENLEERWYKCVGAHPGLHFRKGDTYKFIYNVYTQRWECDNNSSALTEYELEILAIWKRVDPPEKRKNVKYFMRMSFSQPKKYTKRKVYMASYKQDRGRWIIVDDNGKETIPSLQEPNYWKEVTDMGHDDIYTQKSVQTTPCVNSPPVTVEDTVLINGCPIGDYNKESLVHDIIAMNAYRQELEKLNADIGTSRWMTQRVNEASTTIDRLKQLIDEE